MTSADPCAHSAVGRWSIIYICKFSIPRLFLWRTITCIHHLRFMHTDCFWLNMQPDGWGCFCLSRLHRRFRDVISFRALLSYLRIQLKRNVIRCVRSAYVLRFLPSDLWQLMKLGGLLKTLIFQGDISMRKKCYQMYHAVHLKFTEILSLPINYRLGQVCDHLFQNKFFSVTS